MCVRERAQRRCLERGRRLQIQLERSMNPSVTFEDDDLYFLCVLRLPACHCPVASCNARRCKLVRSREEVESRIAFSGVLYSFLIKEMLPSSKQTEDLAASMLGSPFLNFKNHTGLSLLTGLVRL